MSGDQYLLHKLQLNYFISRNTDKNPRERADALISSMSQICVGRASHIVPAEAWSGIMQDLMKMYSATVDCSSEQGVNNYAEGALTLSGSSAVDSNQWKSSLDEDDLNHAASHLMSSQLAAQEEATLRAQLSEAFSVKGKTCFASTGREKHEDDEIDTVNPSSRGAHNRSSRNNDTTDTTVQGEYLNIKHPNKSLRNYDVAHIPQNSNREDEKVRRLEANVESAERKWCHGNFKTKLSFNHPSHRTDGTKEEGIWAEDVIHGVREAASRAPLAKSETSSDLFRKKEGQNIWQNQSMKRKFDTSESNNQVDGTLPQKSGTSSAFGNFKTAKQQLALNNQTNNSRGKVPSASSYGTGRKVLGVSRKGRGLNSKFVPPVINDDPEGNQRTLPGTSSSSSSSSVKRSLVQEHSEQVDERLEGVDPKMVDLIMREIMDHGPAINWDDIAGLEYAKKTIKEIVVWPMLRPDIFYGLRGPPKGLLLFGPPGTGKTLIGKCIASQSNSTFFSISASSLTSKWVGEGEKMVRALFTVARCHQPAVIFIDEIDSLLSQRSTDEHESSRRIKTEFLIQLDGATSCDEDRLLVVGATNRPQEIDEAARRRLVKRLYIPLPDSSAREQIMLNLLSKHGNFEMSQNEVSLVCQKTDGYSGADVANLCREAALGPIRSINSASIRHVSAEEVRPITFQDFIQAVENVRPSVSQKDLELYLEWNKTYGSGKT